MPDKVIIKIPKFELTCQCHVGGSMGEFGTDVMKLYDHIRLLSHSSDAEFDTAQAVHTALDTWKMRILREIDNGVKVD